MRPRWSCDCQQVLAVQTVLYRNKQPAICFYYFSLSIHESLSGCSFFLHVQRSWFYGISRRHLNNFLHIHCTVREPRRREFFIFGERELKNAERETPESEMSFFFGKLHQGLSHSPSIPPSIPIREWILKKFTFTFYFSSLPLLITFAFLAAHVIELFCISSNNNNNLLHHSSRYWCIVRLLRTNTHTNFRCFWISGQ